jgi:hypothetical protein
MTVTLKIFFLTGISSSILEFKGMKQSVSMHIQPSEISFTVTLQRELQQKYRAMKNHFGF